MTDAEEIRKLKDLLWDVYDILEYQEVSDGYARKWAARDIIAENEWIHNWDRYPDD